MTLKGINAIREGPAHRTSSNPKRPARPHLQRPLCWGGVKVSAREIWENTNTQPIVAYPSMAPATPTASVTSRSDCRLDDSELDGLQRPLNPKPIPKRRRLKYEDVLRCIQGPMVNVNNQPKTKVLTSQAFRAWDQDGGSVSDCHGRGCCREGSG